MGDGHNQLLTLGWVLNNLNKCRMETLKLSIWVLAGRALKISNRVSIRAFKLSNFERFRTLGFYDFRALKLSKRVTEPVCKIV